jgi:predicted RNA binding protein YcfA (HicA-like mRNA interferase family)
MKRVSGKEFCKILERLGWSWLRTEGAHHIYGRPRVARPVPVPVHGNKTLGIGLQRALMRQTEVTAKDH